MNGRIKNKAMDVVRVIILILFIIAGIPLYNLEAYSLQLDFDILNAVKSPLENIVVTGEDKLILSGGDLAINIIITNYGELVLRDRSNAGRENDAESGSKLYRSGAQNLYDSTVSYYAKAYGWAVIALNDESKAFYSILSGDSREEHATLYQQDASESYETSIKGFAEHILTGKSRLGSENKSGAVIEDYGFMKLFDESRAYNVIISGNGVMAAKESSQVSEIALHDNAALILKDNAIAENVTIDSGSLFLFSGTEVKGDLIVGSKGSIVILDEIVENQSNLKLAGGVIRFADYQEEFSYGFNEVISSDSRFKSFEIGKLSGEGTLIFTTDIAKGEGDKLLISDGAATGAFTVIVRDKGNEASTEFLKLIDLKDEENNEVEFKLIEGEIDLKTNKYKLSAGKDIYLYDVDSSSDWYLYKVGRADIVNILIGSKTISFNEARFPMLRDRIGEPAIFSENSRLWFASYSDYAKLILSESDNLEQYLYDFQLGSDIWRNSRTFENHLGIFGEVGIFDRKLSNGGYAEAKSYEMGAYLTRIHSEGFYLDLVVKAGVTDNQIRSRHDVSRYWNHQALASLEIGLMTNEAGGTFFEPQVSLTGLYVGPSKIITAQKVEAEISESISLILKIGGTLGTNFSLKTGEIVTMYVRSSWENEIYSQKAIIEIEGEIFQGEAFDTSITLGGGFSLNTESSQIYLGTDKIWGDMIENRWQFNIGARINF